MLKTTALMREYQNHKPRFVNFHGWKLPLEFQGSRTEHLSVRSKVGLFDISYMSKIRIKGPQALHILSHLLTNNAEALSQNGTQYSLLCHERGGILDDLVLYCLQPKTDYLLVGNAICHKSDLQWIREKNPKPRGAEIRDESRKWAMLALQGPLSASLLSEVLHTNLQDLKKWEWQFFSFAKDKILVSATGYTGEIGFEILIPKATAPALWQKMVRGSIACPLVGLAARDTLRMEMKYPLYGQDLNPDIDPYSAGLSWVVKNPHAFIGSQALKKGAYQSSKKWVGFCLKERAGVPRTGSPIFIDNQQKGFVTSGALSPCLNQMIGLAYVDRAYSQLGQQIQVLIHGKPVLARVVKTPFVKK